MKQLDPKAFWLFFLSYAFSLTLGVVALAAWFLSAFLPIRILIFKDSFSPGPVIALVAVLLVLAWAFSYFWSRLTYRFYRYELREDGFRKESGVIWKRYVTIPYERIQNVDIYRGVIARLLGLSDLQIQTAGASAIYAGNTAWGLGAEGRLPGLSAEMAEALRDELIARARNSKNQGL
jgi:uncharacterized membrane protein YdbT with pleckstrin-like domain